MLEEEQARIKVEEAADAEKQQKAAEKRDELRLRAKQEPESNPKRLNPDIGQAAAKEVAERKRKNEEAKLKSKKEMILKEFQGNLKTYRDDLEKYSGRKGETLDSTNKLKHYRDLKAKIEETRRGEGLTSLNKIDREEAQRIENELEGLLEKAQEIIAELENEKQKEKEKKEAAAAAAAAAAAEAAAEAKRKKEQNRKPQISIDYFINAIINYIKLLWKTRLFFKYETKKDIIIKNDSERIIEYYKIISVVPKMLMGMFLKLKI